MTQTSTIYGKSLYDLAAEENLTEEITRECEEVEEMFRSYPDYVTLLSEPSIHKKERLHLIDEAFGDAVHPYVLNFLKILTEKGMVREFGACTRQIRKLYNRDHGIADAVVTSAVPLSADQKQALQAKLEQLSGKKVILTEKTDPGVLGGLRVEIDGRLLDGTVETRLRELRKRLDNTVM